ncbi:glycoside hydrolase family 13 protein [Virgibacillus sp. MG-45]|uniref:glycoside hydrolase family 13 protein n=1 Tax=Virgibacillus sp. MG-45 TaxID=3102791 RepID=UPI002EDAA694
MSNQWWKESVVYQIYPRSFQDSNGDGIGDIRGIISRLDYLKELGIDVIWLSPVYQSPNDDNGYDISDYKAIMHEFGTLKDWEEMLAEIHKRGMKLIMDLVINHTSDEHPWFIEARKDKENPYRDYYIWRPGKNGKEPNNWEAAFSGSAWQYSAETDEYYLHLFSKKQPDLNWENKNVRLELYDMMRWWLDKGIDGFRMDVINFISKDPALPDGEAVSGKKYASGHAYFMNGPKVHPYLQEMHEQVLAKYDVMTVGEMPGVTPEEGKLYTAEHRKELDMVFHFEHMDIDSGPGGKWDLKAWSLVELKLILSKWQLALADEGWNSLYWNNHDQPRIVSRFGNDAEYREKAAKMLATTLHFMKGTPYIYQGEEIGMTNVSFESIDDYQDIETINMYHEKIANGSDPNEVLRAIHQKSRDNARTPMQWDKSQHAGFTRGNPWIQVNPNYKEINVQAARNDPNSIFHYYRKLIQLRKKMPIMTHGSYQLLLPNHDAIFAYVREWQGEYLLVLSNFSKEHVSITLPKKQWMEKKATLIISNDSDHCSLVEMVELQPYESIVYHLS